MKKYKQWYKECGLEIPMGWHPVFEQMCEDIENILTPYGLTDNFSFIQVKEKFGLLRVYWQIEDTPDEAYPAVEKVDDTINLYEHMSKYICSHCGKPADYVTEGYICPFCVECWKDCVRHLPVREIKFNSVYTISKEKDNIKLKKERTFIKEWERYTTTIRRKEKGENK